MFMWRRQRHGDLQPLLGSKPQIHSSEIHLLLDAFEALYYLTVLTCLSPLLAGLLGMLHSQVVI